MYQTMEQIHRRNENQLFYLVGDSGTLFKKLHSVKVDFLKIYIFQVTH